MEQTDPDEFSGDDGLTKLLSILQASPLQQLPVPDSFSRLERWHQLRRRDHETIAELFVREEDLWVQLQSALYNPRSSRSWAKTSGGPTGVSASADGAASPMVGAGCLPTAVTGARRNWHASSSGPVLPIVSTPPAA